jgi:hypothetical protein
MLLKKEMPPAGGLMAPTSSPCSRNPLVIGLPIARIIHSYDQDAIDLYNDSRDYGYEIVRRHAISAKQLGKRKQSARKEFLYIHHRLLRSFSARLIERPLVLLPQKGTRARVTTNKLLSILSPSDLALLQSNLITVELPQRHYVERSNKPMMKFSFLKRLLHPSLVFKVICKLRSGSLDAKG